MSRHEEKAMKLTNRLLALGLGIGLCAISSSAMARPRWERAQDSQTVRRALSMYDANHDGLVSFKELSWTEMARARAEFSRRDLNRDGILSAHEQHDGRYTTPDVRVNVGIERYDGRSYVSAVRSRWVPRVVDVRYRSLTEEALRKRTYEEIQRTFISLDHDSDRFLRPAEMARLQLRSSSYGFSALPYDVI
jgi:hypothetical protein